MSRERAGHRREHRITKNDRIAMKTGGCCYYCGTKPKKAELTRDHIIPRSKGGPSTLENLVLACILCNQRKGSLDLETFRAEHFAGAPFYGEQVAELLDFTKETNHVLPDPPEPVAPAGRPERSAAAAMPEVRLAHPASGRSGVRTVHAARRSSPQPPDARVRAAAAVAGRSDHRG